MYMIGCFSDGQCPNYTGVSCIDGRCDPRSYILFGEVSNNYRKMHGFPLKRRLKGKYVHANQ